MCLGRAGLTRLAGLADWAVRDNLPRSIAIPVPHTNPDTVALEQKSKNVHDIAFLRCFIMQKSNSSLHEPSFIIVALGYKRNLLLLVLATITTGVGPLGCFRNSLELLSATTTTYCCSS